MSYLINPSLISEIKYYDPNTAICVFINGGNIDYKQSVTMDMFPLIFFYNPYSISNILALFYVTSKFRVTMDTNNKPAMLFQTIPYYVLKFYQCHEVFYYFYTSSPNLLNPFAKAYYLFSIVQEKNIFFIDPKLKEHILP